MAKYTILLLSAAAAFFFIGVYEILALGWKAGYWSFMMVAILLFIAQYVQKTAKQEATDQKEADKPKPAKKPKRIRYSNRT